MKITKSDIARIADLVTMAARENAAQTVRENHAASEGRGDFHPAFHSYFLATAEGIIDDALRSERMPLACTEYGAPNPLTDKQIAAVRKLVIR